MPKVRTLIFGAGWIGKQFEQKIQGSILSNIDIADATAVDKEIERLQPLCMINCAGKSGKPNVDACERDPIGTFRSNVVGPILLATAASKHSIYFVHLSSGCFYDGDNGGMGFNETEPPNFLANVYVRTKALAEQALTDFDALQLRIRMPISSSPHPRNLLTKLLTYNKVLRAANSITVLDDFFPAALHLIEKGEKGIFNMVNDGIEYHDELLELYRKMVNPRHHYKAIGIQELQKSVAVPRSNCILNTEKLHRTGAGMPYLNDSIPKLLKLYAKNSCP